LNPPINAIQQKVIHIRTGEGLRLKLMLCSTTRALRNSPMYPQLVLSSTRVTRRPSHADTFLKGYHGTNLAQNNTDTIKQKGLTNQEKKNRQRKN